MWTHRELLKQNRVWHHSPMGQKLRLWSIGLFKTCYHGRQSGCTCRHPWEVQGVDPPCTWHIVITKIKPWISERDIYKYTLPSFHLRPFQTHQLLAIDMFNLYNKNKQSGNLDPNLAFPSGPLASTHTKRTIWWKPKLTASASASVFFLCFVSTCFLCLPIGSLQVHRNGDWFGGDSHLLPPVVFVNQNQHL